jgi:hypothetical protein
MASMSVEDTQDWLQEVDTGNGTRTLPDEVGWAGAGVGMGVLLTILAFADIEIAKDAGVLLSISLAKCEVVLSVISFIIGLYSSIMNDRFLGVVGLLLGGGAMILCAGSSIAAGFNTVSMLWILISIGFSSTGLYFSGKGLGWF